MVKSYNILYIHHLIKIVLRGMLLLVALDKLNYKHIIGKKPTNYPSSIWTQGSFIFIVVGTTNSMLFLLVHNILRHGIFIISRSTKMVTSTYQTCIDFMIFHSANGPLCSLANNFCWHFRRTPSGKTFCWYSFWFWGYEESEHLKRTEVD